MPDGTLAPIDDSKVGERGQFGLFPNDFAGASQLGWRWQHATVPYETENNIDMAPFSIVAYDDAAPKQPLPGSANRFYAEGGNVVPECFREGEEPVFGITFDGGFELAGDLPLVEEVRASSRNVATATGGTATVSGGNASFGTLSSGGLY